MQRDKYDQYRSNLPADAAEVIIPGGNHAQFGDYGPQKGDGEAAILPDEQLGQTVRAILPLLTGAMH